MIRKEGDELNNSGIYSLAGFAYQINVFIYYLTQLKDDYALGFETFDDVALQRSDIDSTMQEEKLQTYNGIFNSPSGITALQVKRTALSNDDYEKVLFNWIILNNSSTNVENFILVVDKSYGNTDSVFPAELRSLYDKIITSNSSRNALITQVKEIINGDYALFIQLCESIKGRYSFKEIDDIESEIFESYKPIFNHGGVKDVIYKMRIRDFAEKIQYALLEDIAQNHSYKCDYAMFKTLIEDVVARIKDDLYIPPDFSNFRRNSRVDIADTTISKSRQYIQLKKCAIPDSFIKEQLIFEEYYNTYKLRCLENLKSTNVENIEYTTHFNFEMTKSNLQANGNDTPNNRLFQTQQQTNTYAHNDQIRNGSAIHLTKADTPADMLISWEDETNE